jgi:hypothetical protein
MMQIHNGGKYEYKNMREVSDISCTAIKTIIDLRTISFNSHLPSPSYSLAILRARDEAISGAWAAGTITSKMASLCSA